MVAGDEGSEGCEKSGVVILVGECRGGGGW